MDFSNDNLVPIVAIIGGCLIAMISISMGVLRHMTATRQKETSRREIAAYVAEGSMSPDDAERLLNAGKGDKSC